MTSKQERIVLFLMSVNALAFVVIFLSVAFNYRLASDDYHHAHMVSELGIWKAMVYYYNNWNPRWSSILITNLFLSKPNQTWLLFLFHCCSLLLGFLSLRSLIGGFVNRFQLPFTQTQSALLSIYLVMTIFYSSFSKTDTWFWITVNPMYLWGTLSLILGGSLIIHEWNYRIRYPLIAIIFLFAGGSSESAAISGLTVLLFLGLFLRKSSGNPLNRTALHLATVACMVGFGISMMGDGIQIRREHLPSYPVQDRMLVGLWNYVRFNFFEIPQVLPLTILAVAPFGFFGRKHLRFQLISIRDVVWSNKRLWFLADVTIAIIAMAIGWVMCEMGPHRTWFPITILVVAVSVALAYQLGSWAYIVSKGNLFKLVVITQVLFFSYQLFAGTNAINSANAYATAHDARTEFLSEIVTNEPITIHPLPKSGWLLSGDISSDPNYFTNKHLGLFSGLNQTIVVDSTLTSVK